MENLRLRIRIHAPKPSRPARYFFDPGSMALSRSIRPGFAAGEAAEVLAGAGICTVAGAETPFAAVKAGAEAGGALGGLPLPSAALGFPAAFGSAADPSNTFSAVTVGT